MTGIDRKTLNRLVEHNPLVMALVLSLFIHLGLYGGWHMGKRLGWWQHHPSWLAKLTSKLAKPSPANARPKPQERAIAMTFVEVDPETVTAEAPPDAKHYSSKNSKATNPDPKEQEKPKVDGKQEQVVRLMDNQEKSKPFPLQPSSPKPKPEEVPEPKPKTDTPGDLALVKPNEPKPPSEGSVDVSDGESLTPPKERPRTLAEARAQKALLTGEKIKQDGGTLSRGRIAFDTKATPFGEYDAEFIRAVEQCWHILLDQHQGTHRPGKVVVDFRLTYDGRITDVKVQENEVGEILSMLCQSAIVNPSPYPRWPAQMRQTIGGNTRDIRFTFHYINY
jgi:hypothetical protein